MNANVKSIAADYYSEMQRAFKSGTINFANLHLDDNIRMIGPNEKCEGKKTVEDMLKMFITMVNNFDIKRQYFDEESCCTILDCVVKSPRRAIGTVELMMIKNGKIVEMRLIYDTLAWQEVMQAQQR